MTWVIAGQSLVCKTIREGFNSLPRLHFYFEQKRSGIRMPQDYSKAALFRLVIEKHDAMIVAKTDLTNLQEKYIALSKKLSNINRTNQRK